MANVLICEDHPSVLNITRRILELDGYDVCAASNGSDALDLLYRRQKVDLLLTDLVLPPPTSGIQLITRAKALIPQLPVILMTGYSPDEVRPSGRLGDLELLSKPFSRVELLQCVSAALPGPGFEGEAASLMAG